MLSKMFDVAAYIVVHFHLHKVKAYVYKSEYFVHLIICNGPSGWINIGTLFIQLHTTRLVNQCVLAIGIRYEIVSV